MKYLIQCFICYFTMDYRYMLHSLLYSKSLYPEYAKNMEKIFVYDTLCARKVAIDFEQRISAYGLNPPETRYFGRFECVFGIHFFGVKFNHLSLIVHGRVTYNL